MTIVGVIGCGYWGPNLLRCMVETNRCNQITCYDRSPAAMAKVMRRFPWIVPSESVDDLINGCDAVVVATPISTHYELVKKVLLKGKHVLVEKPLATSSLHSRELVDIAAEKNVTLMVGHTFVYSPPVRKVKEYLQSGAIGQVFFLSSSRVNLGIHQRDADVLWDLGPHDVSILLYWLEEMPLRVSAVGRACVGRMPDVANLHFEFPSGIQANLEISWLAPSKLRRSVIVGSRAMLVYDDTNASERVKLYDRGVNVGDPQSFGEYQLSYRTGEIVSPNVDAAEPLLIEANHFLDCVENGTTAETNGLTGLDVVVALEAASEAMKTGRAVDIPRRQIETSAAGAGQAA